MAAVRLLAVAPFSPLDVCLSLSQNSFSRALGFTCIAKKVSCESGGFHAAIAVSGALGFCILAEFECGDVIFGCEQAISVAMAADALQMPDMTILNANVVNCGDDSKWRFLSWHMSSTAALKTFTICATSSCGPDVGIGWVGAVAVGAQAPAASAAESMAVDGVTAVAVASRTMSSFDCATGCETCDIQCLWSAPSAAFFPCVDVYLASEVPQRETPSWCGRSASGVFIIRDALLSPHMRVVLMGITSMLQRITLADVSVAASFIPTEVESSALT
jgi:hypothetical protein